LNKLENRPKSSEAVVEGAGQQTTPPVPPTKTISNGNGGGMPFVGSSTHSPLSKLHAIWKDRK